MSNEKPSELINQPIIDKDIDELQKALNICGIYISSILLEKYEEFTKQVKFEDRHLKLWPHKKE